MSDNEVTILDNIVKSLNKNQAVAVKFNYNEALQVIAGPGTGKTKVLISRVAYILLKYKIKPQNIIVTTFTNKAAKEMIDRLSFLLKDTDIRVHDMMIGTFHSICMKILTKYGSKINLSSGWRIADEREVDNIVTDLIKRVPDQVRDYANSRTRKVNLCIPSKNNSDEWVLNPKMIKKNIEKLKADAIIPENYYKLDDHDPALAYFYQKYQEELHKLNALDFDDLLMYAFILLSKERCLPYIRHVFVDEFQDTNGIQIDLMYLLAKGNHHQSRGITVVGDPDQSIYAFRNALSHNFQQMSQKCPINISQVILEENYRSSQKILNTSEKLISQQTQGRTNRLPLRAQFDIDFPPVYIKFPTNFLQSPSLVREMLYLKALPSLFTYSDFAILVRQRRQIKNIEKALIENRIPYKIIRGHAFWEAKEIISMLSLLKCVYSDNEKNSILSSLLFPSKGLGQTSADRIKLKIEEADVSAFQTIKNIASNKVKCDIPEKALNVLKSFIALIENGKKIIQTSSSNMYKTLFETLYENSGLKHEFLYVDGKKKSEVTDDDEPNEMNPRHLNILILKDYFLGKKSSEADDSTNTISQASTDPMEYIREFFNSLSLNSVDTNRDDETEEEKKVRELHEKEGFVTISTIHSSKGLEWPVVFIPGCDDGIIPCIFNDDSKTSVSDSEEEDEDINNSTSNNNKKSRTSVTSETENEERRMFFVAQTRAKYLLFLSSVESIDEQYPSKPSRFLTAPVLSTLADEQKVFTSVDTIKQLYKAMKRDLTLSSRFSLSKLVSDYNKFVTNRREFFYWNNNIIRDLTRLDLNSNSKSISTSAFTTAAVQLEIDKHPNGSSKKIQYSPKRKETNKPKQSPIRSYAPNNKVSISSNKNNKKSYAPQYSPVRKAPNSISNTNFKLTPQINQNSISTNENNIQKNQTSRTLFVSSTDQISGWSSKSSESVSHESKIDIQVEPTPVPLRANTKNTRRVHASVIDIDIHGDVDDEDGDDVPLSYLNKGSNSNRFEEISTDLDTTAAELLHNPNDSAIDNRPIIASAKILADAVRNPKSKKGKRQGSKDGVKQEVTASQFDIFTQLSKAKKKAKSNNGEIIIID